MKGASMNKTYEFPPLSRVEEQRFAEIEFYLNVKHIFNVCGNQQATYELIEVLCRICDASITLIKALTSNINAINSQVKPYKDELAVMLYRNGMTLRNIEKHAKISTRTIYRYIEQYYEEPNKEFLPRVKEEYFAHVTKFNKLVKELMPYDGYTIQQ